MIRRSTLNACLVFGAIVGAKYFLSTRLNIQLDGLGLSIIAGGGAVVAVLLWLLERLRAPVAALGDSVLKSRFTTVGTAFSLLVIVVANVGVVPLTIGASRRPEPGSVAVDGQSKLEWIQRSGGSFEALIPVVCCRKIQIAGGGREQQVHLPALLGARVDLEDEELWRADPGLVDLERQLLRRTLGVSAQPSDAELQAQIQDSGLPRRIRCRLEALLAALSVNSLSAPEDHDRAFGLLQRYADLVGNDDPWLALSRAQQGLARRSFSEVRRALSHPEPPGGYLGIALHSAAAEAELELAREKVSAGDSRLAEDLLTSSEHNLGEALAKALQLDEEDVPLRARLRMEMAIRAVYRGNLSQAESQFSLARQGAMGLTLARSISGQGFVALLSGDAVRAGARFQEALALQVWTTRIALNRGYENLLAGRLPNAFDRFSDLLREGEMSATGVDRGLAYMGLAHVAEAQSAEPTAITSFYRDAFQAVRQYEAPILSRSPEVYLLYLRTLAAKRFYLSPDTLGLEVLAVPTLHNALRVRREEIPEEDLEFALQTGREARVLLCRWVERIPPQLIRRTATHAYFRRLREAESECRTDPEGMQPFL